MPRFKTTIHTRTYNRVSCDRDDCPWPHDRTPPKNQCRDHTRATGHTVTYEQTERQIFSITAPKNTNPTTPGNN